MDFGRSFSFVFEDSDWLKKVGIMALVTLIPVIGQFVLIGWGAEIIRRVVRGADTPLPELDFGEQLGDGFKLFVIALVYSLPIIVLSIIMGGLTAVAASVMDYDTAQIIGVISSICFGGIIILYSIVLVLILPAAYGNFAMKGNIADGLRIGELFGYVKNNISAYLIVLLGTIVASFVASLGSIACGIGILLTTVYANAMMMHLYGQAYKKSVQA
ncbi:MAG: DUF4013 domain-containing protein [Anaerolineaceae bacterium]|nr:DUF4013 domain-containing protein [Anaerolineaceae bacterium]